VTPLILGDAEVRRLLPFRECIEAMDTVLRQLAAGTTVQPLRTTVALPGGTGLLGSMPAYVAEPSTLGIKVITVFPGNRESGRPTHRGVGLLFDPTDGAALALLDATSLTEIRTACVSAVATRALAPTGARVLTILGSGAQAEAHALAIPCVRPIREIRLWGRRPEKARALADRLAHAQTLPVEVLPDAEAAVRTAEIICTTTGSRDPVLRGDWLAPGTHVNAVGAVGPGLRELDAPAVARSRLFVDQRAAALAEADDLRVPLAEGSIGPEHVRGDLGDVLRGTVPGRLSDRDITLFKSVGLAVEDLAAARLVYDRATATGVGVRVDLSSAGPA
jgi:ornithine cyclodeaminase/alanine dehydrogenase-like protein (mu-crystallin family)